MHQSPNNPLPPTQQSQKELHVGRLNKQVEARRRSYVESFHGDHGLGRVWMEQLKRKQVLNFVERHVAVEVCELWRRGGQTPSSTIRSTLQFCTYFASSAWDRPSSELEAVAAPCGTVSNRSQTSLWRRLRVGSRRFFG